MNVIEIPSSPEASPRAKPKALPPIRAKKRVDTDTIELSDSEDEVRYTHFRERGAHAGRAGPSRTQPAPLRQHKKDASIGSLENIPAKRRPKSKSVPLFLPSDEENEPPPVQENAIIVENFPTPPPDPIPGFVGTISEIIPDVDPEYVLSLVRQHYPQSGDQVVEPVLHALFEDPSYPKRDRKGKRKRVEEDEQGDARGKPKGKLDYGSKDREYKGGLHYADLSVEQLMLDFPYIPKPHIRRTLLGQHSLYAPTHLFLAEEKCGGGVLPYVPKTIPSRPSTKGKRKALHDAEFEKERAWIISQEERVVEKVDVEQEPGDSEDGIECGCCFADYTFDKMIQCPDAHLFCTSCMTTYAETLLGSHDHKIICMDQSGCKLPFPDTELHRFLTPKLMSLYERVKQTKEVEAAGIEGLEECPFCDYKCVIENEHEKLFTCRNEDGGCAAVSCRQCKKLDHLPKSCKEMEDDKNLDGRHTIEEAMTRALMRNCPKCQQAFIKEQGCNKMSCPNINCRALSCYICRKLITGYDHFNQQPGPPAVATSSKAGAKCPLWDSVEQRHADEVKEAAEKAVEEYKLAHPDIDEEHLKVDLPVAPPPPPPLLRGLPMPYGHLGVHMQAAMANAQGWMMAQLPQVAPVIPPIMPAVRAPRRRAPKKAPRWR